MQLIAMSTVKNMNFAYYDFFLINYLLLIKLFVSYKNIVLIDMFYPGFTCRFSDWALDTD